jgi:hypothetical protein
VQQLGCEGFKILEHDDQRRPLIGAKLLTIPERRGQRLVDLTRIALVSFDISMPKDVAMKSPQRLLFPTHTSCIPQPLRNANVTQASELLAGL